MTIELTLANPSDTKSRAEQVKQQLAEGQPLILNQETFARLVADIRAMPNFSSEIAKGE